MMPFTNSKRVILTIFLLGVALSLTTYRIYQSNRPDLPVFHTGKIRVAVDPSIPPFAYFDESDQLVGLDVDLAYALGKHIGLPVDIQIYGIDGLFDALKNDNVDIIISALQPESWRMGDVRYSNPYFETGLLLVTNDGKLIQSMYDLPGNRLAYAFGTEADTEARMWSRRIKPFQHRPYEQPNHALDAVRLAQADAALVDAVSAHLYLREYPSWRINMINITHQPLVIAVELDRSETLKAINQALDNLNTSGQLEEIISGWM